MFRLLKTFSWQELLHHPWRTLAAAAAVMLGVALAFDDDVEQARVNAKLAASKVKPRKA